MKGSLFWDIRPCSPLKVNRRFGGTCRLNLHGRRISRARNQQAEFGTQWTTQCHIPEAGILHAIQSSFNYIIVLK
jgi:hypothetical protein